MAEYLSKSSIAEPWVTTTRAVDEEQADLIAACPVKLRCLVMLLLLTGARVGETFALTWEDVSEDGVLTFRFTKNRQDSMCGRDR